MTASSSTFPADRARRSSARVSSNRVLAFKRAISTSPAGFIALVVLVGIVVVAVVEDFLPLPDPMAQQLSDRLEKPLTQGADGTWHLLGTDQLGRDVLSRIVSGTRVSLGIAVSTILISGTVGSALGLSSGYRGGLLDQIVMRLVDIQMAVPPLLLAIFLLYIMGSSLLNLVVLLAILSWWSYARVVRAETLRIKNMAYVEAATVIGCPRGRVLFRHVLPQILPVLVVVAVVDFAGVILAEAGISFLGFGVQPPDSSWGRMVSEGQQFVTSGAWWLFVAPGAAIFVTVLLVRLSAQWIQTMVGPDLTKRR